MSDSKPLPLPLDFKKLMSARFLFTFGVQMQAVVVGWQIYELLQDPLALGLVGLAEAVPALGLALYAGNIVDRGRPLIIYRRMLCVSFLSALIVLLSQLNTLHLDTSLRAGALYFASVLTGLARAFSQPSMFAIVPRIVPRSEIARSSAWMSSSMQVARIAGPAFGGIIFGWWGVAASSTIVCLTLLSGIVAVSQVSILKMHLGTDKPATGGIPVKENFFLGAKFVFNHPILLPALSLDMISVLFGGVTALLPIFAKEILLIGPKGLGVLRAAPAVGAALMSFLLTRVNVRAKAGAWLFSAVAGFGVCILVFGLSTNFYLSFAALFMSGALDSISMVIRTAAVQLVSPDDMRGRISAVNSIFIGSSNEIGELESGIAAKLMGTVPSVIFGGIMCLVTVAVVAIRSPALRKLDLEKL